MNEEKTLPRIETPEIAKNKLIQTHLAFVDCASKFYALATFYSETTNKGKMVDETFQRFYDIAFKKLKNADRQEFSYQLAFFAILPLTFIEDIKDNIDEYHEILEGQDPSLSDYDKSCDLLAIRDTFIDLQNDLLIFSRRIAKNREIEPHYNDKAYDLNARD